ncbi:elongation factor P [Blattabacterium sp. (Cryptocercus punctulatus) str. Cpu]|uniref:elongation factor P n=1 Tax=Blattabacterium sp. (Cryptocercus punctulatus) str. Cpu TaxID=1075399 RepID=UPI0002387217|nr:elongation factor P [Blattabacterium sp. (Cryptocercus punctulatus) str. Cpu]AEU09107.1 elongation factor P [Blattabacterium sp. (Cryptocercus punctulatus) str. Cpu]
MYTNIKKGLYILHNNNDIYKIIDFLHVKPGKGYAFIRTKLKNIMTGHILEINFSAKHKIKKEKIEIESYRYLYRCQNLYYFMNIKNYDQIQIEKNYKNIEFLKEGIEFTIFFHVKNNNKIILFIKNNPTVILKVKYTESVKKGDTINKANKIAILETKTKLLVPTFINSGEYIKINTDSKSYIERVRK